MSEQRTSRAPVMSDLVSRNAVLNLIHRLASTCQLAQTQLEDGVMRLRAASAYGASLGEPRRASSEPAEGGK